MQIAPSLHRLGNGTVNAYLVEEAGEVTIVDAGLPGFWGDLPAELRVHYVSLLIKSKIGRYIAMTMPPTMTPRNAIITGSISVSSPATAVSTSSS